MWQQTLLGLKASSVQRWCLYKLSFSYENESSLILRELSAQDLLGGELERAEDLMNLLLLFTELALLKAFAGFVNPSKVWHSIEGDKAAVFWLLVC